MFNLWTSEYNKAHDELELKFGVDIPNKELENLIKRIDLLEIEYGKKLLLEL